MIVTASNIKSILNKKPTFVKKFTSLDQEYDFNFLTKFLDDNSIPVFNIKPSIENPFPVLWQVKHAHNYNISFFTFLDFFKKTFKYTNGMNDGVDLFFSFVALTGISHVDMEDVFLIGLHGQTMYQDLFTGKNYIIEKGDLLFFPKQNPHRAISLTPRIILSVGVFGEKL
jgi:hypothetical protein|tara:strand:+ start:83 stop:592 length:510 start_codon:yes stop_codon:yes gene_type:complete